MSDSITEVNKDTFWTLIGQARDHLDGSSEWLKGQLMALGRRKGLTILPART